MRGYQTVFNVTPAHTVSTEKHQSFSFVGGQLYNLQCQVSKVKTGRGEWREYSSSHLLVGDQVELIEDRIMFSQVLVFQLLFLLPKY